MASPPGPSTSRVFHPPASSLEGAAEEVVLLCGRLQGHRSERVTASTSRSCGVEPQTFAWAAVDLRHQCRELTPDGCLPSVCRRSWRRCGKNCRKSRRRSSEVGSGFSSSLMLTGCRVLTASALFDSLYSGAAETRHIVC